MGRAAAFYAVAVAGFAAVLWLGASDDGMTPHRIAVGAIFAIGFIASIWWRRKAGGIRRTVGWRDIEPGNRG